MRRRLTTWPKILGFLLVVGGVYCGLNYYGRQLIYSPSSRVTNTPAKIGLLFDNVFITTPDGININGWFVPADVELPTAPTLLFFRRSTGNMSDSLDKLRLFHDLGLTVFIIDYRGYGKSGGVPSEQGLTQDAVAAYFYLTGQRGVPTEQLFLFGETLGAAVAIDLATKVDAAGLIAEAAFTSIFDRVQQDRPYLPLQLLTRDKYDCAAKIRNVRMPVLLVHSADDEIVPFREAELLYAAARDPKELFSIHGTHADAFVSSFDTYYDKIALFISQHTATPALEAAVRVTPIETGLPDRASQ